MDQWLRPVFARTRTPVQSLQSLQSAPSDRSEDNQEAEDMKSIRPGSRVSSYMGFRSSTANLHTPDTFTFQHVNIPEDVYHKPSGNQMAETLKVVMMTRNLMEPVPVEYNTCILHVLESYNDLQEQLEAKDKEIEENKLRHTKDIAEFDVMGEQWKTKEKDYQKEIKNLEVLLSKTEGGMENVTMARSKSVIHGTRKAADVFEDGMEKIKQNFARYSSGRGSSATTAEWDIDPLQSTASPRTLLETPTSAGYLQRQEDVFQERTVGLRPRERSTQDTESFYSAVDHQPQPGSRLTSVQLDALERQHATAEELGVVFDSSSESDDTSSRSAITEGQVLTPHRDPQFPNRGGGASTGIGMGIHNSSKEKPLPDIPISHQEHDPFLASETGAQPWVESNSQLGDAANSIDSRRGFSFNAGDDTPSMLQKTSKYILDRKGNTIPSSRLSYVMNNEDEFVASPRLAESSFQLRPKPDTMGSKSTSPLSTSPGKEQGYMGLRPQLGMGMGLGKGIERGDSTSSIITAVRDNSGRSEGGRPARGNGNGHGNAGKKGAGQGPGQGAAVMAAVRAIAASNKSATTMTTAKERIPGNEFDRREGVPFSPERSPTGSQAGGYTD